MARARFSFTAEVWEHDGPGGWHFVGLPEAVADEIEAGFGHRAAGFGSVRVEVAIGSSRWSTSIFPDRERGTYLLPVKKPVRVAERIADGSLAHVELTVVH
jgi:hypothetical protein